MIHRALTCCIYIHYIIQKKDRYISLVSYSRVYPPRGHRDNLQKRRRPATGLYIYTHPPSFKSNKWIVFAGNPSPLSQNLYYMPTHTRAHSRKIESALHLKRTCALATCSSATDAVDCAGVHYIILGGVGSIRYAQGLELWARISLAHLSREREDYSRRLQLRLRVRLSAGSF